MTSYRLRGRMPILLRVLFLWILLPFQTVTANPFRPFSKSALETDTRNTIQSPLRSEGFGVVDDNGANQEASVSEAGVGGQSEHKELPESLARLLDAVNVMQSEYFELWAGTWPSSIDWTAAVLGTHVSATLNTFISTVDFEEVSCAGILRWENTINRYFDHLMVFYFGENSFSLRNQAYDDMLWVVLGWLENVKFSTLYTKAYWEKKKGPLSAPWHGTQLIGPAAHRARTFWDLASQGWGRELCDGGMTWNPSLEPYKNAITNELFISASIAMYLYFPGDDNDSPFLAAGQTPKYPPHEKRYLHSAIRAYDWLKSSNMKDDQGLYMDGFHITGWRRYRNGTTDPGTRKCDKINTMVFTYNQGVVLSGLKGLWISTNDGSYIEDGHELIQSVIRATGWPHMHSRQWSGLGRGGILEEYCDSSGDCSQNGHTFKGIFFHHLTEFCRPLWASEEEFMYSDHGHGLDYFTYKYHQHLCLTYTAWIRHNAHAADKTRNDKGMYGTWWGRPYDPSQDDETDLPNPQSLPDGATDYRNFDIPTESPWINTTEDDDSTLEETLDTLPHLPSQHPDSNDIKDPASTAAHTNLRSHSSHHPPQDLNDRGRGRTVETQSGGLAVFRALWEWEKLTSSGDWNSAVAAAAPSMRK